jgi:Holliday junction resolvase RusA-like endonuclease
MERDNMVKIYNWEGLAVSENRRLKQGKGRWYANPNYKVFLDGMTWKFHSQKAGIEFARPDVLIVVSVGTKMDHHNLHKPILDALERAGIIDNDRNVGWVRMAPPEKHPQGQLDKVTVILTGETVKK